MVMRRQPAVITDSNPTLALVYSTNEVSPGLKEVAYRSGRLGREVWCGTPCDRQLVYGVHKEDGCALR